MSLVFNVLEQPGLTKLEGQLVIVELVASLTDEFAPGYVPSEDLAVFSRAIIKTDEDGRWELDLRPTFAGDNVYSVTGLVYKVTESAAGGESAYYIDVHAANIVDGDEVPQWVGDLLTVAPSNLPTQGDFTAADIPLDTSGFDNNLNPTIGDVQEFADYFDDFDFGTPGGSGGHVIKQGAETFTQRDTLRVAEGFLTVSDDNINAETVLDLDLGTDLTAIDLLDTTTFGRGVLELTDETAAATYLDVVANADIGVTVPSLVDGVIPVGQLPALAINDVFTVGSQAAMLALDAEVGDVAIRTDTEQSFILADLPATLLGNWVELSFGGDVASVNGQTGVVILTASDVGAVDTATFVAHVNDTVDAHDGSAISLDASGFVGNLDGTVDTVQELAAIVDGFEIGTGAPTGAAGGELTGTYPNPTVALSHSGSTHAAVQAAAEATAAGNLSAHIADTSNAHVAQGVSIDATGFGGGILAGTTTVQTFAATVNSLEAVQLPVDTSGFVGNLTASESTVQAAFDKLDLLVVDSPVVSVNGGTGAVILDASDVGAIDVSLFGAPSGVATLDVDGRLTLAEWPDGLVTTVNGYNGSEITLVASDIGIDPSGFSTNLDGSITDVQLLAEAVDTLVTGSAGIIPIAQGGTGETTALAAQDALGIIETIEGTRLLATPGPSGWNTVTFDVDLTEGLPGGDTLVGGSDASDILTLASTSDVTRGTIVLRDPTQIIGESFTHTDTSALRLVDIGDSTTITLNDATTAGNAFQGIEFNPTVVYDANANGFTAGQIFIADPLIRNATGEARTMSAMAGVVMGPTVRTDAAMTAVAWTGFWDAPNFDVTGGSMAVVQHNSFQAGATVDTGVTVALRRGLYVENPSGGGTITTNIGLQIDEQTLGTTDYAINYGTTGSPLFRVAGNGQVTTAAVNGLSNILGLSPNTLSTGTIVADASLFLLGSLVTYPHSGSGNYQLIAASPGVTMGASGGAAGTGNGLALITVGSAVTYSARGNANANTSITSVPTITNSGNITSLGAHQTILSAPTFTATAQTVALSTYGLLHGPTYAVASAGVLNVANEYALYAQSIVGSGVTITNRTGVTVLDPTGSGSVLTNIGIDIPAMTKGSTANYGVRSLTANILNPIYGSTASGGHLPLRSTTDSTKGDIQLDNPTIEVGVTNYTNTANFYDLVLADYTVTMNASTGAAGNGNTYRFIDHFATVNFDDAANSASTGSVSAFADRATYQNVSGEANPLGKIVSFNSGPVINTTAATIAGSSAHIGFWSAFVTNRTTSGTLTLATAASFQADATVLANTVVTTRYGVLVNNPTNLGTITTQVGVQIEALSGAGTNKGLVNKSSTELGSSGQTVIGTAGTFTTFAGFADAVNITVGTSTGTKIGTATGQKLGFWNVTPVIQPANANQAAVGTTAPAGGTGAAAGGWSTAGNRDTAITTINSCVTLVNQLRSDLVAAGIIKGSA